jgi:hypothetical protein
LEKRIASWPCWCGRAATPAASPLRTAPPNSAHSAPNWCSNAPDTRPSPHTARCCFRPAWTKPPQAWRGTTAEADFDLSDDSFEQVLFEGSARDAARLYPKNANVAVAVGLCSLGLDLTRARLVSSPNVADPLGVIEAEGACGRFRYESYACAAAGNAKTSLLTAYSLLQCARLEEGLPVFSLLDDIESGALH